MVSQHPATLAKEVFHWSGFIVVILLYIIVVVTTATLPTIALVVLDRCCNTCEEVKDAYRTKGWALPPLKDIEQCVREGQLVESTDLPEEGCQIYGYLEVNRVSEVNAIVVKVDAS